MGKLAGDLVTRPAPSGLGIRAGVGATMGGDV